MSIEAEEKVDGLTCFRAAWSADWNGWRTYQSEAWCPTEAGVLIPYRETFLGRSSFDRPYVLLSRPLNPGDAWSDSVMVGGALSATLDISVGEEEQIETPAGSYRALPVSIQVNGGAIVRWYAKGVGMVRETTYLAEGDELALIEDKRLSEHRP
ncbi:MAG: hypothetical protein AAF845_18350 [Bacteroidota bacterium]